MADGLTAPIVLVPVGTHFFTPEALQKALDKVPTDLGPDSHGGAVASVDAQGMKVALQFTSHDSHWRIRGAYSYDWNGDKTLGGDLLYKF